MSTTHRAIQKAFVGGIIIDDLRRGTVVYSGPSRSDAESALPPGSAGSVVESDDGKTWRAVQAEGCFGRTYKIHPGPVLWVED